MILFSRKINLPCITSFETNVDANSYKNFWESLNVNPQRCDFIDNFKGCLAWGTSDTSIKYIYGSSRDIYSSILAVDIDKYVSSTLIADAVDSDFRKQLVIFSKKMTKISKKNIKQWLKLKINMDSSLLYYSRFVNEYERDDSTTSIFVRLDKTKKTIMRSYQDKMYNRIEEVQKIHKSIMSIFQSNADYRSLKANYRIQQIILVTTVISVMVAIVSTCVAILALFVTAQSGTEATEVIKKIWSKILIIYDYVTTLV